MKMSRIAPLIHEGTKKDKSISNQSMSQNAGLSVWTNQTIKGNMLNLNLQSEMRHPGLPHRTSSTRQDQANKQNSYTRTNLNPTQLYEQIDTLGFRLLTSVSLLSRFRQRRSNLRFLRRGEWREELANCLQSANEEQGRERFLGDAVGDLARISVWC